jgi:hypothetical protein
MAPASKPGKLLCRRRKEKNRSTNINEEPHLAPLRAFLLTNLKPQWQSHKDCQRHFFVFIPTKQINKHTRRTKTHRKIFVGKRTSRSSGPPITSPRNNNHNNDLKDPKKNSSEECLQNTALNCPLHDLSLSLSLSSRSRSLSSTHPGPGPFTPSPKKLSTWHILICQKIGNYRISFCDSLLFERACDRETGVFEERLCWRGEK